MRVCDRSASLTLHLFGSPLCPCTPQVDRPLSSSSPSRSADAAAAAQARRVATLNAFAALRSSSPILLKHGRRGKAHKTELHIHEGTLYWEWEAWKVDAPTARAIPLVTVSTVLAGRRTDELRRSSLAKDEGACFAVVTPTRQLSLQVLSGKESERDLWVAGLTLMTDILKQEQKLLTNL